MWYDTNYFALKKLLRFSHLDKLWKNAKHNRDAAGDFIGLVTDTLVVMNSAVFFGTINGLDIVALNNSITTNIANIATNLAAITANVSAIATNATNIATNVAAITANALSISGVSTTVSGHTSDIGSLNSDVSANNTHRSGSGSGHSDVALNNAHRTGTGVEHSWLGQNIGVNAAPVFTGTKVGNGQVGPDTGDGSDNQSVIIRGGGGGATARGGMVSVAGNEAGGDIIIDSGNVSGTSIIFRTGGTTRMSLKKVAPLVSFFSLPTGGGTALVLAAGGELRKQTSSRRYKKDIKDLGFDTGKIFNLRPVSFKYKSGGGETFGYLAEEVFKDIPEIVECDKGTPESVHYELLPVLILEELKKLASRVKSLENAGGNRPGQ